MCPHRWHPEHYDRVDRLENHSYRDYLMAETICIKSFERTVTFYTKWDEPVKETILVPDGEVMADSRGRGSFQK